MMCIHSTKLTFIYTRIFNITLSPLLSILRVYVCVTFLRAYNMKASLISSSVHMK